MITPHGLGNLTERGCAPWNNAQDSVTFCTEVGEELVTSGNLEEVFLHETAHLLLDKTFYEVYSIRYSRFEVRLFIIRQNMNFGF